MSGPFSKTLQILSESTAPEAEALLLAGIESTNTQVAISLAKVLIERQGVNIQRELLRRFPRLDASIQHALRTRAERFDGLLKQMLLSSATEQCLEGLNAVRCLQAVDQIPRLVELLTKADFPAQDDVVQCLQELVVLIEDELRDTSVADSARTAVSIRRDRALAHLDHAIRNYDALQVPDPLIESILILGPLQHATVKYVLWQSPPDCRERANKLVLSSRHPKIIRHVLDSLRQAYPHPKAFEAIRTRSDVDFLSELFRFAANSTNSTWDQNLKQVNHLSWLEADDPPWDIIPPSLQPSLLSFVMSTRVSAELKAKTQDWLLRHGSPAGRMAAAEHAALTDEHVLQDVLVDSLNAEDEHVQAWAVTQLRQHAVPAAFALLLDRLDSPLPEVQAAARDELSDFTLERALSLLDGMDARTAIRVGDLVRKVDPEAGSKLAHDLQGVIRPKRIRAAQAIVKLGFEDELLPDLLSLAEDQDFMIRRVIAEVLESILDPDVLPILEQLTSDTHPRVRETATLSLTSWQNRATQQVDPFLANTIR